MTELRRVPGWTVGLLILLAPFQNCGRFQGADLGDLASLSQCRAEVSRRARARAADGARDLACAQPESYLCERRVFAPDQPTYVRTARECADGDLCVEVVTRGFDTSPARTADNARHFLPGADYNHVETRCQHRWTSGGQAVLAHEGASVADALREVRRACARVMEGRS